MNALLKQRKSILLLGPRQTGKTTLLKELRPSLYITMTRSEERRRYELNPDLLIREVESLKSKPRPLVIIDEIQKVPALLDAAQFLIDNKKAQFILTGSSARKLRKQGEINLLPGRVIYLNMDPLTNLEFNQELEHHLLYGSLPAIALDSSTKSKALSLRSYVDLYLEEEVRGEALVRNLPAFYRFLELAAWQSGKIVSFNSISQELGIAHTTVSSYFDLLDDCLMVHKIDPISKSHTRKRLTKSSKFIFFDLGVRRFAAREGTKLSPSRSDELFEEYVGIELIRLTRNHHFTKTHFWRDPDGPEVDWVLKSSDAYLPIEVKFHNHPSEKDIKHLLTFMNEYHCPHGAFVVCNIPRKLKITKQVTAIPWQELLSITDLCE